MTPTMNDDQIAASRSHLFHLLVQHDHHCTSAKPDEPWPNFYARHLRERFASR